MTEAIQIAFVKATNKEKGEPKYSHNWTLAKRTFFKVYTDRIEVGNWIIPFNEIKDIVLFRTKQMFIPVYVLNIQTEEENYQIGFNPWVDPTRNIPLNVRHKDVQMTYSTYSVVVRVAVVAYLAYLYLGN